MNIDTHDLETKDKKLLVLKRLLSSDNPIRQLIDNNAITDEHLSELYRGFSIASGFERKLQSNAFSVNISLRSRSREKHQIAAEMIRRYKSAKSYNLNQRRYFQKRLLYGSSFSDKNKAISWEIIRILKGMDSNDNSKKNFYLNNLSLKTLIEKIRREPLRGGEIITRSISSSDNEIIKKRLNKVVEDAIWGIKLVDDMVFAIETGHETKYIPLKIRKKKREKRSNVR